MHCSRDYLTAANPLTLLLFRERFLLNPPAGPPSRFLETHPSTDLRLGPTHPTAENLRTNLALSCRRYQYNQT